MKRLLPFIFCLLYSQLTATNVPGSLVDKLQKSYPGIHNIRWFQWETAHFEALFQYQDKSTLVAYSADGNLIATGLLLPFVDAPDNILDQAYELQMQLENTHAAEDEFVIYQVLLPDKPDTLYYIDYSNGEEIHRFIYNSAGALAQELRLSSNDQSENMETETISEEHMEEIDTDHEEDTDIPTETEETEEEPEESEAEPSENDMMNLDPDDIENWE